MKKGILATILTIQLILLVLITFSQLQVERESFVLKNQYQVVSAYRVAGNFFDIQRDINYLNERNSTEETLNDFFNLIECTYPEIYSSEIFVNESFIRITDKNLEIIKEGVI